MDTFHVELSICNLNLGYLLPRDGGILAMLVFPKSAPYVTGRSSEGKQGR